VADPAYGIREFVVGTGGKSHYAFSEIKPNSQVRNDDTFGVLMLTLHSTSYSWRFVPEAGGTFTDSGTDNCHGAPGGLLLRLSASKRVRLSRAGSFRADARCAASCSARVQAIVFAGRRRIRSRLVKRALRPERRVRLRFKFSAGERRAMRSALRSHKRLRVRIVGQAKDPAGHLKKTKLLISLRR
jgi:hypothetical protein